MAHLLTRGRLARKLSIAAKRLNDVRPAHPSPFHEIHLFTLSREQKSCLSQNEGALQHSANPWCATHHLPVVLGLTHGKKDELLLGSDIRVPAAVESGPLRLSKRRTPSTAKTTRYARSRRIS